MQYIDTFIAKQQMKADGRNTVE